MEDIISKYKNGDEFAREELIESIMEMHNYKIDRTEAIILLQKKYGVQQTF